MDEFGYHLDLPGETRASLSLFLTCKMGVTILTWWMVEKIT